MNRGVSTKLTGLALSCLALLCGCHHHDTDRPALNSLQDLRKELASITRNSQTSWRRDVEPGAPLPVRILAKARIYPDQALESDQVREILQVLRQGEPDPEPMPVAEIQPAEPVDAPDWPAARRKLNLQVMGVSRQEDGSYSALLKDLSSIGKDDTLSAFYENKTYTWQVLSVSETGLVHLKPLEVK